MAWAVPGSWWLGVAYKPDVEDVRESPALEIIAELIELGAEVAYYDPLVKEIRLPHGPTLTSIPDPVAFGADLVLVHTAHSGHDLSWASSVPLTLDATYRFASAHGGHTP